MYTWSSEGWASDDDPELVPLLNELTREGVPDAHLPGAYDKFLKNIVDKFDFDRYELLLTKAETPERVY
jgi:hypothetical protein